ncbi:TetR/AcrR family transcriptional regulator [Bradyrhizobium viridifuturi]|uniref:TetR/AcrR family transcriptional regulator n=1 Tax=Bradyrhizobium viridifuturi TaxID=1654716 RepID=UPI000B211A24|nr:TetR/AcrR family transcriptional regulator [Bradyrhizobium viridifuturi]
MPDTLTKTRTPAKEGLRERNRRQTLQRIADAGMELFLANGFEATTLDEIAAAAGISRRTFFYYFKSKDDILLAHIATYDDALRASIRDHAAVARRSTSSVRPCWRCPPASRPREPSRSHA